MVTLQSGVPVAVTQATNINAFAGFGTQRPNLVGDPELPADERTVSRWFNTAAFATAPQFTLGSSSRNPVRGPGYRNLDLALVRRVPLPRQPRSSFAPRRSTSPTRRRSARQHHRGFGRVRDDHDRRRSASHPAGGQITILQSWLPAFRLRQGSGDSPNG